MMTFHPQKCQLLRITRNKSPVKASYVITEHTLGETDTAKYLGVSLHKHSYWSTHVNTTANKVIGTRAFLQRNQRKAPTAVKTRTHESLIRPILEYSGVVWDPHTTQDVKKLDMVQRRYARYISRITMMYRIVHGLVDILASDHIIQAPASRFDRQCPVPHTIHADFGIPARILPDSMCLWNALSNEVTEAESIDTYKERLSQLRVRWWDHSSNL